MSFITTIGVSRFLNKVKKIHITHYNNVFLTSARNVTHDAPVNLIKRSTDNVEHFVQRYACLGSVKKKKAFYILDENVADCIADSLKKYLKRNDLIVEINPGPGFLTKALFDKVTNRLIAIESHSEFLPYLEDFQKEKDVNLHYFHFNLFNSFKSSTKSNVKREVEKESKITELIPHVPWEEDVSASVVGILPPDKEMLFLLHLTHNFSLNEGLFKAGRLQWFLLVSPRCYRKLISNKSRRLNVILELLFDINICCEIPISSIHPRYSRITIKRMADSVDPDMTYMVQLTPKPQSLQVLHPEEIYKFSFFLSQLMMKKTERLIPRMEQLVPGCGIYLIKEGYTMMQTVKKLTAQQCLHIYQLLPSIPEYYTSGWRNFLINEGLVDEDDSVIESSESHHDKQSCTTKSLSNPC